MAGSDKLGDPITSTRLRVRDDADVKKALQRLFDVFADLGLGQATFEITGAETADLFVKHPRSVTPDRAAIAAALASAGEYLLVDADESARRAASDVE